MLAWLVSLTFTLLRLLRGFHGCIVFRTEKLLAEEE